MSRDPRNEFWGEQLDAVMSQIAREAAICQVRLLDPGVIEAVLHDNPSVCGKANPRAFKKLRESLMVGLVVREKAVEHIGALETEAIAGAIRERLKAKLGDRLGGTGPA